jgi:Ca2+-binding RTX toxin-like protein
MIAPHLESLEPRDCPSRFAGPAVLGADGTLTLTANDAGDAFYVKIGTAPDGNVYRNALHISPLPRVEVRYDLADGTGFHLAVFPLATVKSITFTGGTGNDLYHNNAPNSDVADGGPGNDQLEGCDGAYGDLTSALHGGDGDDVLQARANHNTLDGGNGADVLVGSLDGRNVFYTESADMIFANRDDLVIGTPGSRFLLSDWLG